MALVDYSTGNAQSQVRSYLDGFGLGALSDAAWEQWNKLGGNADEFVAWLRSTPEYKQRFPYMDQLRQQGRAISEADALGYERNVRQLLRPIVPEGFLTQDYVNKLILNDVSYNELQERVATNLRGYYDSPDIIKQEFQKQMGAAGDAAVAAYYLDPEHTVQQFGEIKARALVRGYGQQYGFNFSNQDATQIGLGRSAGEIQQGLSQAASLDPLTRSTIGDGGLTDSQVVGDVFAGDQRRINRQLEQRAAEFSDGGGPQIGQQKTGFGAAR